jgi:hypothetical protein
MIDRSIDRGAETINTDAMKQQQAAANIVSLFRLNSHQRSRERARVVRDVN